MLNNRNILIIFLSFFALIGLSTLFGYGTFKTRGDYENNTGNILLSADEKELVFYNLDDPYVSDALDANTVSLRASGSLTETYYLRWPIDKGDPCSFLMTPGVVNSQLRWMHIDANFFRDDPNEFALPTLTPGSRIFVDANGFPLYEDNDNAYFDDINDFAGFALGHIASGTRPNNYIQVYTLLDFEPTLFNTVIGRGSDDVATGPNSVTIGYGAGALLDEGYENALGGKDAGRYLQDANDNAGWGYKVIGGAGDGNVSGDYTEFFVGMSVTADYKYNILVNATTNATVDTTWGESGYWGYQVGETEEGTITPTGALQLDDGRMLITHNSFIEGTSYCKAAMVNTDGTLDTTWGTNGFFVMTAAMSGYSSRVFYKVLQDNDGSFHFFGGMSGVGYSGYVKSDADGIFVSTSPVGQYTAFGFVDAVWSDSSKTRILAIGITETGIWTGSEYVAANIMAIDPATGERDETWAGNLGYAGFADFGGGYKIRLLSDGDFVTFQNGSPTMQKFLADGSALDTVWGDSGVLDIGTFAASATANRITVDGDYIYCITVETVEAVINNVIRKIDSTGTVVTQENIITGSNSTYHCIQVVNGQLILGTTGGNPANYAVEFWSQDLEYESGFDIPGSGIIYIFFPDEETKYPTSLDVHRVTAVGAYAAGLVQEGADDGLYLGTYSGQYNTTDPNVFFLDNLDRGDYPGNQQHGMMYGYFDVDPNDQWLTFNVGELNLDFGRFDVNDVNITGTLDVNDVNVTGLTIAGFDEGSVLFTDVNGLVTQDNTNFTFTDANDTLFVKHLEATTDANSPQYYVGDSGTYITTDGSDNLTLTDAVTGTKTLAQLGSPTYIYIKAETQAEGDLHLSDGTNWGYSKAQIAQIRVVTSSTDWDLYILQNDNGYAADDATIGKFCRVTEVSGDATLLMNLPYEDEDDSGEVHLYYNDDSGSNTADIYIIGYGLN